MRSLVLVSAFTVALLLVGTVLVGSTTSEAFQCPSSAATAVVPSPPSSVTVVTRSRSLTRVKLEATRENVSTTATTSTSNWFMDGREIASPDPLWDVVTDRFNRDQEEEEKGEETAMTEAAKSTTGPPSMFRPSAPKKRRNIKTSNGAIKQQTATFATAAVAAPPPPPKNGRIPPPRPQQPPTTTTTTTTTTMMKIKKNDERQDNKGQECGSRSSPSKEPAGSLQQSISSHYHRVSTETIPGSSSGSKTTDHETESICLKTSVSTMKNVLASPAKVETKIASTSKIPLMGTLGKTSSKSKVVDKESICFEPPLPTPSLTKMSTSKSKSSPLSLSYHSTKFERDSVFDQFDTTSLHKDEEYEQMRNDVHTYVEMFDHPSCEYSSSQYIRSEYHRRKKIRKSIEFYKQSGELSRDAFENEVLQIFPRDAHGNILKPKKKRLVPASSAAATVAQQRSSKVTLPSRPSPSSSTTETTTTTTSSSEQSPLKSSSARRSAIWKAIAADYHPDSDRPTLDDSPFFD